MIRCSADKLHPTQLEPPCICCFGYGVKLIPPLANMYRWRYGLSTLKNHIPYKIFESEKQHPCNLSNC